MRGLRVLALVLLAVLCLFVALSPYARPLRYVVFDGYQRLLPLDRTTEPVAIVLIDEDALLHYGQWPWPRTRVADLVVRISEFQPAAIAIHRAFRSSTPKKLNSSPANRRSARAAPR